MTEDKNLIEPAVLHQQLNSPELVILDCSWYLPTQNRVARDEYRQAHIPGARFFDIDAISDQETNLPHTIPSPSFFADRVEELGISNTSHIVAYDGAGLFSAARVWWMFHLFGHRQIAILNGGLPAWVEQGYQTTAEKAPTPARVQSHTPISTPASITKGDFSATLNPSMIAYMKELRSNCGTRKCMVLDARSTARFNGKAPEPRTGLSSGHIPGAISLPFTELMDGTRIKPATELTEIFNRLGVSKPDAGKSISIITSCGSGVTAAIITLALSNSGYGMQRLYDGSWSEWASIPGNPIQKQP